MHRDQGPCTQASRAPRCTGLLRRAPHTRLLAPRVRHSVVPAPLHRHAQVLQLAHARGGAVALAALARVHMGRGLMLGWVGLVGRVKRAAVLEQTAPLAADQAQPSLCRLANTPTHRPTRPLRQAHLHHQAQHV